MDKDTEQKNNETSTNDEITLKKEEFEAIKSSLDELKIVKETLAELKNNSSKSQAPKTVRDKLIESEEKEKEKLEIQQEVEKETGLRDYLFDKADSLGGRVKKIAEDYKNNYYAKGFATSRVNSELLKEFIVEIATDKEINTFIPKYKQEEIKQFLELPENSVEEQDVKLKQARKLIDVINSTLEIKGRTEEEIARNKAKNSFGNPNRDETQARYYQARDSFKKSGGMKW